MKTTYIGQEKVIVHNGCYYRITETSSDAVVQAEWARELLAKPNVTYPNGRQSHEAAGKILEKAEDRLIDYMLIV